VDKTCNLMKRKIFLILLAAVFAAGIAFAEKLPVAKAFRPEKELYKTFANPDARHRPYVRWWWNGARVNEQEILRHQVAGFVRFISVRRRTCGRTSRPWHPA